MMSSYESLIALLKEIKTVESIGHLLSWDQETMMPENGIHIRSKQLSALAEIIHKKQTSASFTRSLKKCFDLESNQILISGLTPSQKSNLRLIVDDYKKSKKLPGRFIKELAELKSISCQKWSEAKKQDRFSEFSPYLKKMVEMMRKKASYLGYLDHPYDALLDLYEPKMTVAVLDPLFASLKKGLLDLLKKIREKPRSLQPFPTISVHESDQLNFCRKLAENLGLNPKKFRLDLSAHPFCDSISSDDVRMTTHIQKENFIQTLYSTLHETGHALYESFLPEEHFGSPLGESCSLGIHESQSRLFETFIGQSRSFVYFLTKQFQSIGLQIEKEVFYQMLNQVEPGFIRIESDEVTYCLHIMVRYELEKKLIEGSLSVDQLPKKWNELMQDYLGMTPPNDRLGCLQDIHWSSGLFGYFPTYALGNLYAAQLFKCLNEKIPHFDELVNQGQFDSIVYFLNQSIYRFGREKSPQELIQQTTQKPLSCNDYLDYLNKKYK